MDFKTDYVRQQIKDERLQDLLIKSRARNKYSPVQYQGRTYWCLEELTKEKELESRHKVIREMTILGIASMIILITSMYGVASMILP